MGRGSNSETTVLVWHDSARVEEVVRMGGGGGAANTDCVHHDWVSDSETAVLIWHVSARAGKGGGGGQREGGAADTDCVCDPWGFRLGHYRSGECKQPDSVDQTLRLLVTPGPVVCILIALVSLWLYPIDETRRRQIREDVLLYQ